MMPRFTDGKAQQLTSPANAGERAFGIESRKPHGGTIGSTGGTGDEYAYFLAQPFRPTGLRVQLRFQALKLGTTVIGPERHDGSPSPGLWGHDDVEHRVHYARSQNA